LPAFFLATYRLSLDNSLSMPTDDRKYPSGPLSGLTVLDLSRVLAGPWCSQLLADYGAKVIKVEQPGVGDATRAWGPPWLHDHAGEDIADSAYHLSANRNKRSVCIDFSRPDGAALVAELAGRSDIFLENFVPGTLEKYGLDYATIATQNKALIYCSISAYGQSGTRLSEPGYDAMIQAEGGLMSITGEADGPPQKVGVAIADIMCGMYAATAILAANVARQRSGVGQHIDVPLYDSQVAWLANQNMNFLIGGKVPNRLGGAHPNIVPYQTFKTRDGFLTIAVGSDRQFGDCVRVLGVPDLADDVRFQRNADRVQNRADLISIIANELRRDDTAAWLSKLKAVSVPAGPVQSIDDVLSGDYAQEREFVRVLRHSQAGDVPTVANPVRFSATPVSYRRSAPTRGQHTRQVLAGMLDMSAERLTALADDGTIEIA